MEEQKTTRSVKGIWEAIVSAIVSIVFHLQEEIKKQTLGFIMLFIGFILVILWMRTERTERKEDDKIQLARITHLEKAVENAQREKSDSKDYMINVILKALEANTIVLREVNEKMENDEDN